VLGVSSRFLWKRPTERFLHHYDRSVTDDHLDAGVGTGCFLDRRRFPSPAPRVALTGLNSNALDFAARGIARYKPETYFRNVLEPISFEAPKFDSIGAN
jgi:methylase of polypeptide subunit release factors